MATITIIINTDNEAFQDTDGHEINRILAQANRLLNEGDAEYHPANLRDSNGNTVGTVGIEYNEEEE